MSITINPDRIPSQNAGGSTGNAQPGKKIFGLVNNKGATQDDKRSGVYTGSTDNTGLSKQVERIAGGKWYSGPDELANVLESFTMAIAGDRQYGGAGIGASFGFLGHLARRLPSPILFDDPKIAQFIFGQNAATAAVDTSGRMWVYAGFLEECLKEEARDKVMVLPLMSHEYLHIALNHTKRMHQFPPGISNQAKDKVINPMAKKMFDAKVHPTFSDIFKLAHGNAPEDARFEGLSEETTAKKMMQELRENQENKGTLKIKNLIIVDGVVGKTTVLKAGKGEIKQYGDVTVTVQDMGMMDKIDTEFDCASLEIDNIDNRLKVRRRNGPTEDGDVADSPIMIPVQNDQASGGGKKGQPNGPANPSKGSGSKDASQDQKSDQGNSDADSGRKSLEDIQKDMQAKGESESKSESKSEANAQGAGGPPGQDPAAGDASGQNPGQGGQGNQPGQAGQAGQSGSGGAPGAQAGADSTGGQGQNPGRVNAGQGSNGSGTLDPQTGSKVGDANGPSAGDLGGSGSKGFKGSAEDLLGGLIKGNPLNSDGGHEVDIKKLNDWLGENGYEDLLGKMRSNDFDEKQVERAIEVSLKEASKERLIIGSGYAGGHVEDYMHTVVRPSTIYKVNFLRRAVDFLQGTGNDIASTMDEYGVLTYIEPEDMGLDADDGVYYPGHVQQKPEGAYFVIIDTSGSIWCDKKRLGHLAALAIGVKGTQDEMSPDVYITGADTVVSGKPHFYDEDAIIEAVERGVPLGGGGGTDYALPINQVCAWCKDNEIKPLGIIYVGDFEVRPPKREELPEDCPPLLFGGMPHDVVRAAAFVRAVSSYAEVFIIEDNLELNALAADAKAEENRGLGHDKVAAGGRY